MGQGQGARSAAPAGLGFALGAALLQRFAELPSAATLLLLGCAGMALVAGGICRRRRHAGCSWAVWCAWVALGFVWAGWQARVALDDRLPPELEGVNLRVHGVVAAMPLLYGNSTAFELAVSAAWREGRSVRLPGRLRLTRYRSFGAAERAAPVHDPDGIAAGAALALTVRLKRPYALANPLLFDGELRLLQEGVGARGYVREIAVRDPAGVQLHDRWLRQLALAERMRARVRAAMRSALAGADRGREREAGVLIALAVGDQAAIGARDWALFNRTGISHLMSISGLHVTMIAALGMLLGTALWRRLAAYRPRIAERATLQRTRWLCAAATATAYCVLAGWGVPAQRTLFMVIAAGIALCFGRGRSVLQVMAFAAGIVTLVDPWASLAAGFWLSFGAVAALLWSANGVRLSAARAPLRERLVAALAAAGRTQAAVTIALVPLGAVFFGSTSVTGALANALAIPVVTFIVTPLALLGAAMAPGLPVLGQWPLALGAETLAALFLALDALDGLFPFPWVIPVPPAWMLLAALLGCAWVLAPPGVPARRLGVLLIAPLVFAPAARPPAGALWITALDVGQGSAVLVRTADLSLLFDAGPAYGGQLDAGRRIIVPWLRAHGVRVLDLLMVSHLDRDHSGGALSVVAEHRVRRVLGALPAEHPLMRRAESGACRRGMRWRVGGTELALLHPPPRPETRYRSATNARSCVLRVATGAGSVLLTGDIEAAQERRLVALFGDALRSDVLIVPHHGSGSSSSAALIATVRPRVAIVQAGYRNRFRHPQRAVLARYARAGVALLRTDREGAIELRIESGAPLRVQRFRRNDRRYWRLPPPAAASEAAAAAGPAARTDAAALPTATY